MPNLIESLQVQAWFLEDCLIITFTNSFFVIATITYNDSPRFTTNNFFLAIAWTWRNGVGDFRPEDFSANRFLHLCEVIWLLCTFFVMILFMNLLIAVLSDSFKNIQETLENNLLKEMAIMMSENEILINRKKVFKDMKYLIVVQKVLAKLRNKFIYVSQYFIIKINIFNKYTSCWIIQNKTMRHKMIIWFARNILCFRI